MNCRILRIKESLRSASRTTLTFSSCVPLKGYGCDKTYVLSSGDWTRPINRAFLESYRQYEGRYRQTARSLSCPGYREMRLRPALRTRGQSSPPRSELWPSSFAFSLTQFFPLCGHYSPKYLKMPQKRSDNVRIKSSHSPPNDGLPRNLSNG